MYVFVFNFIQTSTKNTCNLPCNEMLLFCYIARSFSNRRHCVSITLVNLGKRYFCKHGRTSLHFELRASDCAKKLKTTR